MQHNANVFMMQDIIERWNQGRDRLKRMLLVGNVRSHPRPQLLNLKSQHADTPNQTRRRSGPAGQDDPPPRRPRLLTHLRRTRGQRRPYQPPLLAPIAQRETAFPFNCRTVHGLEDYYFGLRHAAAMALPLKSAWDGPDVTEGRRRQEQSPLFGRLPLELRVMVYELVFEEGCGPPLPGWCPTHPRGMTHAPRYQLALLRTCKRAYAEASDVFCSATAQRYWFTKYPPPKEFNMLCEFWHRL
jgi:hypothetical protein